MRSQAAAFAILARQVPRLGRDRLRSHVRDGFTAAALARRCRQLQHGGALAGDQAGDHDNLAAGEFQRIVMDVGIVQIDLPEAGHFVLDPGLPEQAEGTIVLDVMLEGDLGCRA